MVDASTEFVKSGFNEADSLQLAKMAAMYQNIADEQISAGEAANFIISQMKAFNLTAQDSEHIISAVNNVSNNMAVSSADLATNIGKASAALAVGGNTFEQTLALMTGITEVTRSGTKAARGLVSVQSRFNQIVDESSDVGKALTQWYKQHNIEIYDQEGQLRTLYDTLSDVAKIWPTLTKNEQAYYLNQQAGANQSQNLAAALSNFDAVLKANDLALNSANSAMRENAEVMESLEAKTNLLKATFQELSTNVVDSTLVSGLLSIADTLLKLVNTPVGTFAIQVGLVTASFVGLRAVLEKSHMLEAITGFFTLAKTQIAGFAAAMQINMRVAGSAVGGFALTAKSALSSLMAHPLLAGTVAVFGVILPVLKAITNAAEDQKQKIEELANEVSNLQSEYDRLKSSSDLTEAEERRLKLLEAQLAIKKEILAQEKTEQYKKQYNAQGSSWGLSKEDRTFANIGTLNQYTEAIKNLRAEQDKLDISTEEGRKQMVAIEDEIQDYISKGNQLANNILETSQSLEGFVEDGVEVTETGKAIINQTPEVIEGWNDVKVAVDEAADSYEGLGQEQENIIPTIDELINAEKALEDVAKDLYEYGGLTSDSLMGLTTIFPNLTSVIYDSSGALSDQALSALDTADSVEDLAVALAKLNLEAAQLKADTLTQEFEIIAADAEDMTGYVLDLANSVVEANKDIEKAQELYDLMVKQRERATRNKREKKETDPLKEQSDLFKKQIDLMKDRLKLAEKQGASDEYLVQLNKEIQQELHNQANWFRNQGLTNESEYVRELMLLWYDYEDNVKDIYKNLAEESKKSVEDRLSHSLSYVEKQNYWNSWGEDNEVAAYDRILAYLKDYYERGIIDSKWYYETVEDISRKRYEAEQKHIKETAQQQKEALQQQINDWSTIANFAIKQLNKELEDIDEAYQDALDDLDDELENRRKVNEELEDQIGLEERLDALAKARQKKVLVYKNGQYQYLEDTQAVSDAQKELEKYNREQALKDYEDYIEYKKEQLEKENKITHEAYEDLIEQWEWLSSGYKEEQDALLAAQRLGIDIENKNWNKRLDNLNNFVKSYAEAIEKLNALSAEIPSMPGGEGGRGPDAVVGGGGGGSSSNVVDLIDRQMAANSEKWHSASADEKQKLEDANKALASKRDEITGGSSTFDPGTGKWNKHAKGTLSSPGGISLVGEKGAELRVLNQGDGVLPSDITKNLWQWGMTTPSDMMANLSGFEANRNEGTVISINNFSPNLPNVENGADFVQYITQDFVREVVQFSGKR